jgi:HPt (histidine-containing phosphotransfer) domain-containing protein
MVAGPLRPTRFRLVPTRPMTAPTPTPTPTARSRVWDETDAIATVGGDRALALEMLNELVASLPAQLKAFEELSENGQLADLAETAHQLKGGAAYCGVPDLTAALEALDQAARSGSRAGAEQALPAVIGAIADLLRLDLDALTP